MKNIGLALGGGAVLGAAHVGVLKAIDENNIKINFVTGTSIGAFVAALYAFGKDWKEIKEIASGLKWLDITSISLSRFSLLSNKKFADLCIEHIGNKNIEDAIIPLAIIATDATNGEKVVLKNGPVANAIMASTCIPGVFKPIEFKGQMLIDGGIVENVPIQTLRDLGADFVIGVDLNAKYTYETPQNILDVILNSFHFIMMQSAKLQTQNADLLIKPDLSNFSRADINQVEDLMEKGYQDAIKTLKTVDFNKKENWLQRTLSNLQSKLGFK